MTICIPPLSSKNRSKTTRRHVGSNPIAAFCAAAYSTACRAASGVTLASTISQSCAAARSTMRHSSSSRSCETASESSAVRPGASPCQNGIDGGAPPASETNRSPPRRYRTRHDVFPSTKMSPAWVSLPKCSSTVPTVIWSSSVMTRIENTSGMAPALAMAAIRAPGRALSRRCT